MGSIGINLAKNGLIVIAAMVFALGTGTAYAGMVLPTINLSGDVIVTGDTELEGKLLDTNNDAGISGQVLSSTETGIDWIDNIGDGVNSQQCLIGAVVIGFDESGNIVCSKILSFQETIQTLDSTGNVGQYTSIAIGEDGFPIISYFDDTNSDVKVVHCTNKDCSGTADPVTIDSGTVGPYSSIAIGNDGLPLISYAGPSTSELRAVHCTSVDCSTSDTPEILDTAATGAHISVIIGTDGFPVISHKDNANDDLKVTHCTSIDCSTFDTPITIDSTDEVGEYTSIAIGSDGFPVISYYDATNNDLKVTHCTSIDCSTFDTPIILDSSGGVGQHTSIAIGSDGFPVISYYDATNNDLKLVHCTTVDCSTFDTPKNLVAGGEFTSIAIGSDGFPIISHFSGINDDLLQVECSDNSCSSFTTKMLDSDGITGKYTSIAITDDGIPAISYYDETNGDLKLFTLVAVLADNLGNHEATEDLKLNGNDIIFGEGVSSRNLLMNSENRLVFEGEGGFMANQIRVGTDDGLDDDLICFDNSCDEYLAWDESQTQFELSDGLRTVGEIDSTADILAGDDIGIGIDTGFDDDVIFFDDSTESMFWDDSQSRFEFTADLAVAGPIQGGSTVESPVSYHRFGTSGTASHGMSGVADVFVQDDLEVNDDIFVDGGLSVGTNDGTDDDFICMDSVGFSGCTEFLKWENTGDRFVLSNDLDVAGTVSPPTVAYTSENHDSIKQIAVDFTGSDEVMTFWNTDTQRMEIYHLTKDKFYNFMGEEIPYQSNGIPANSILNRDIDTEMAAELSLEENEEPVEPEVEQPEESPAESEGQ